MKILAIRGCNLASLAGEFEIDLARGPLGGSGVFAIVGNTGAGKSTLLDALCVALFDKTPRLNNHSTVKVGRGTDEKSLLGAQDVRTLLRRGASQGWAEVDFESSDAQQYRARWSVRRARGQVDGNLQDQQLSLMAIVGGERFGGTKTETLRAIQARLGLSFDQFRRSALLAQGEFAAFLRADGKDRSELLERMTGTQIYTKLSIAAHLRATLAEQRLRDGRAAALAISVLDDAQVNGVREELAAATTAARVARRRHQVAVEVARWQAEAARRQAQLDAAAADHAGARAAVTAAEADRAELALRQRAERLRPAWDEAARLERGVATAIAEVAAAGEAAALASERLDAIAGRRLRVATIHAPVREARIAAGLVERTASAAASETVAPGAASDAAWLVERRALVAEVAAWPELDARFAQHAALADALGALDRAINEQAETRSKLDQAHKRLVTEVRAATGKHEDAKRKAASFAQKRGLTLDAAGRLENEARVHLAEIERLVALATQARDAVTARGELDGELAALATAGQADARRRGELGEAQRVAQAVRAEQAVVVEGLRRAAGYEHARAELVDGEPCPLCGADEHPWRDRGALDDVIAAAEARLAASMAELDAMATEVAALGARDDHRRREQRRLGTAIAALTGASAALSTAWRERLAALGELMLVGEPADAAAGSLAADRLAAAKKRLDEAKLTRSQAEAATKAAQDAQNEIQLCQNALDQLTVKLTEHDKRVADLDASLGRARGEQASKAEHHETLEAELATAMRRWRAALPAELDDDSAEAPRAKPRGRRAAGGAVVAVVDDAVPLTAAEIVALVGRLTVSAPVRQVAGTVAPMAPMAIVRAAMAAVVMAWRARAERIALADAALAAATVAIDREAREVDRAVAEHMARRDGAEQRRDQLQREQATAVERLAVARAEAGFEPDGLRRLLGGDPSRLDALVERLAEIDRAVEKTRTVVAERERQVAEHAAARPVHEQAPRDATGALDAADVDGLAAAVTAADQRMAQLAATLAADGEARERRAAALADVEAESQGAEVDRVLGDVIGSHDGKLFRSFAQSLTLDSLLAVANDHLEELAPRYQLERVPRHDLELQVIDRDLGAEVRSVQSLSGGESFLVSLALALGLSSMSAHDVRVRTLLIDEGFGTLDPATLDSALSVLDALQATGRQVGVISHVPALVERVGAHVRVVQRGGGRSEVVVA